MDEFNELNLTDAVLERLRSTPDPRLQEIMMSAVRHLHDFVRDVRPTFDEWSAAIRFLTRVGQISDETRQEFILLSDIFGVSMLVDAINHPPSSEVTDTTVLGPFYGEQPPEYAQETDIANGAAGEPLCVDVEIKSADGKRLPNALVDVWQSDSEGFYDVQRPELAGPRLRARFRADQNAHVRFRSIMPTAYPIPHDGPVGELLKLTGRHPWRPAHLHFLVAAPGHETLVTHLFVRGDKYLESDAVFGVKNSLVHDFADKSDTEGGRCLKYTFRLKPG
jgi:hydroxyquinol 1,2-dioxygenase